MAEAGVDAPSEVVERTGAVLRGVEDALARLETGTYGQCVHCGATIDDADLDAAPLASACAAHREGSEQRPAAQPEEPVGPPGVGLDV